MALTAGLLAATAACSSDPPPVAVAPPATLPPTTTTEAPPTTPVTEPAPPPGPPIPTATVTATPNGKVPGFDEPDGPPVRIVDNLYYGIPTTLPVVDHQPGWVKVRLAPKPNGSTSWLRLGDVTLGSTPWHIVINLATTHLQLYKDGKQVLDAPVGVGTDYTPTATGQFFVTHFQRPPSAMYGPFVMITSGHSNVIQSWEGFPDGILAIHGPIGADGMIADTGVHISNGCIRMHVADQQQLAGVQPGTLVDIVEA